MFKNHYLYRMLFPTPLRLTPPHEDGYYGRSKAIKGDYPPDDTKVRPFKINVPDSILEDLKHRLANAHIHESIADTQFRYGFNSATLKTIVDYWKNEYDWKKQEQELGKYNHFVTQIEGIDIHFVHVKPANPSGVVLPLIAVHGWPGTFYEYIKSVDKLTDSSNGGVSFEVVIPSIPGYGFSEAPHQEGLNVLSTARIFVKLMKRLGYNKFFAHGGDWGSVVTKSMAVMYPENIRGYHTNFIMRYSPQGSTEMAKMIAAKYMPMVVFYKDDDQRKMFESASKFDFHDEGGYYHIQSTKPDTIGAALTDSPVGLVAWILEKFSTWTNKANVNAQDGGLLPSPDCKWTLDELLTNVMIYWVTSNVTASMRYYKENLDSKVGALRRYNVTNLKVPSSVPCAYAAYPNEIVQMPRIVVEMALPNLIQYTVMPRGGHFAAFEEPDLFVDDIKQFARAVVSGRNTWY